MSSPRTEPPTPRRRGRARARGEIATSRDLTSATALLAGLAALATVAPATARLLAAGLRSGLSSAAAGEAAAWPALLEAMALLARGALAPCGAAVVGALVAGTLQARGLFTLEPLRPRMQRLSVASGLARIASVDRLAVGALGALKAIGVLAVAWRSVSGAAAGLAQAPRLGAGGLLALLAGFALRTALLLGAIAAAFGALDLGLVSRRHRKALMMSRDEIRREQREDQGDPRQKAERRRLHGALAAAGPLRRATCLVVNPTHVAVALEHARERDDAPIVIAKATGPAAARLRSTARRAGVPIVRDVGLARALFRLAEVGDEIPVELYDAAAAILAHLYGSSPEGAA